MNDSKLIKFLEHFSIITVAENKVPNFPWKKQQTERLSIDSLLKNWKYKGGIQRKDGKEIPATTNFGIITGFEDLECIDVDLKVFSTAKEQRIFWDEFLLFLRDNILDFDEKFVIYKTKNAGYHILYKSKRVQGNLKLAALKGHKEAVIETRGIGGYIFTYPENKVSEKSYFEVEYISDSDREVIISTCKMYNYIEPIKEVVKITKDLRPIVSDGVKPWDDFDNNTFVWDVVSDEFEVIAKQSKKIVIKRYGSTSAHSGYIYTDDNLMFLHSTGTIYPHQKQITPSAAYAYKYHNGNFSESAKDLYSQGFGERVVRMEDEPEIKEKIEIKKEHLIFPIDVFPTSIQAYITECNETLNSSIDYLGCSLLWLISLCVGNSMQIEIKRGWNEIGTLWLAVVGKAGIGKTPSISNMIFPVEKINNKLISNYIKEWETFAEYDKLSIKEKKEYPEVLKPIKKQFIANDITLEALVDLHQESDNAVGVFKDELAGWFKDMNKYKAGSDLEFWLSSWSGKAVNLNRMTRAGSFVGNPLIPVLGGIQPSIFNTFYTDENKDNGFMDRMLLTYPELDVDKYNDKEMSYETLQWYSDTIVKFFQSVTNKRITRDAEGKIIPTILRWSKDAKIEWIRIFDKITEIQNSDNESEYMKSMLPKQKAYIPRFALLLHAFNIGLTGDLGTGQITKKDILNAEKLSEYFIAMAKKVKVDSVEVSEMKTIVNSKQGSAKERFESIYKKNPEVKIKQVAELLGVSARAIYKHKTEIDNK